jgi:hypothetical protein
MRATRILLGAAGAAMAIFAVVGIVTSPDTNLIRQGIFLVSTLLLHDAVLAPLFIAVGFVVGRVIRPPYRAVVQAALIITAAVTFVAVPFLLGYGRQPGLPSALPRNYLGGYAIVLAAIWLVAGAVIIWKQLRLPRRTNLEGDRADRDQPESHGDR